MRRRLIIVALVVLSAAFTGASRGSVSSVKNVDFRGTWSSANGNWTITSESLKTGACAGRSGFAGYTLTGCKVTGKHYVFVVRQTGTTYRSNNSGTITGNTVHGVFRDTVGHNISYVALRAPKKK
jgi:hypothetical protein